MIQHEFIAIDEGRAALLHIDEGAPSKNWIVPIGQPQARDMQLVGGNKILISHHHGYTEFDIATRQGGEGIQIARRRYCRAPPAGRPHDHRRREHDRSARRRDFGTGREAIGRFTARFFQAITSGSSGRRSKGLI